MAGFFDSLRSRVEGLLGVNMETRAQIEERMRKVEEIRGFVKMQEGEGEREKLLQKGFEILGQYGLDIHSKDLYSAAIVETMTPDATVQEITLALTAYVAEVMDTGRADRLTSTLLPALENVAAVAVKKQTFDLQNAEDRKVSEIMIDEIRTRVDECRKLDNADLADIANDIQNGVENARVYGDLMSGLVCDVIIDGDYWARDKGWDMLEEMNLRAASEVVIQRLEAEPEWGAVLLEKELRILTEKIDFESVEDRRTIDSLLRVIVGQKPAMESLGYWPYVLEMLSKLQNEGKNILGNNHEFANLYKEVNELARNEKEVEKAREKLEHKPRVQQLRREMGVDDVVQVLGVMSPEDRDAFQNFIGTPRGELAVEVIYDLFNTFDSMDLSEDLFTKSGELKTKYQRAMQEPEVQKFLAAMMKIVYDRQDDLEPDYDLEFRLAVLASSLQQIEVEEAVKESAGRVDRVASDFTLRAKNGDWYLCDMSEHRLLSAILTDSAILLNDHFVMKFDGKKAALCIEEFIDENGDVFYPGVWYAITDKSSKNIIERAYLGGAMKCDVEGVKFAVMRSVAKDDSGYSGVDGGLLIESLKYYRDRCNSLTKSPKPRKSLHNIVEANNA